MNRFLSDNEIERIVDEMKTTLEVSPLSHARKCELATELCLELHGFAPTKGLQLLIVKKATYHWHAVKVGTLAEIKKEQGRQARIATKKQFESERLAGTIRLGNYGLHTEQK